jgi:hypothetical protein
VSVLEVEVQLLGPLVVRLEGRAVAVGGAKERAVLSLLALRHGSVITADELVDALWGELAPPTTALKALLVGAPTPVGHENVIRMVIDGYGFEPKTACDWRRITAITCRVRGWLGARGLHRRAGCLRISVRRPRARRCPSLPPDRAPRQRAQWPKPRVMRRSTSASEAATTPTGPRARGPIFRCPSLCSISRISSEQSGRHQPPHHEHWPPPTHDCGPMPSEGLRLPPGR